jgi:hypothetical protein
MEQKETSSITVFQYKVRQSLLGNFRFGLLGFFNAILNFFSLRTSQRFWGIVYDSVSKQPLDPVIVKLLYVDSQEVETCVTDLEGRYGFLARPGRFKIFPRKTNYSFPSARVLGDTDGIYENLYHGEFFKLAEGREVVAPNIPMDPVNIDWNQKAKKAIKPSHPYLRLLFKQLVFIIFVFGFILTCVALWKFFPKEPLYLYGILAAFLCLASLPSIIPEDRLSGKIKFIGSGENLEGWQLELFSPRFKGVGFGKAAVRPDGKFLLRANKGRYLLQISKQTLGQEKTLLASLPVKVGSSGVLNSTLLVKVIF